MDRTSKLLQLQTSAAYASRPQPQPIQNDKHLALQSSSAESADSTDSSTSSDSENFNPAMRCCRCHRHARPGADPATSGMVREPRGIPPLNGSPSVSPTRHRFQSKLSRSCLMDVIMLAMSMLHHLSRLPRKLTCQPRITTAYSTFTAINRFMHRSPPRNTCPHSSCFGKANEVAAGGVGIHERTDRPLLELHHDGSGYELATVNGITN
ncbi:hypothetical protein NA57DRAFT_59654 [Rhizodiscina lignyota]|uniref:Uncharacterized protein n=1 Tax=Rhizodiscina lignyota TaxID=1504668 RepID=A0A9P4M5U4_9PEZI|nr:hypothetical protein NA57DRAFT_59654 [Rhizodiscina lignyota]